MKLEEHVALLEEVKAVFEACDCLVGIHAGWSASLSNRLVNKTRCKLRRSCSTDVRILIDTT
jgi:hypothetical protein